MAQRQTRFTFTGIVATVIIVVFPAGWIADPPRSRVSPMIALRAK